MKKPISLDIKEEDAVLTDEKTKRRTQETAKKLFDKGIKKIAAYYPDCPELFDNYSGKFDVVIIYSVFHYVFIEQNYMHFIIYIVNTMYRSIVVIHFRYVL